MADNIYLETRVGRNQTHEPFDDEAEEQGESGDVEVPLSPVQPHVHLHLGIEVAHASSCLLLELLTGVFLHLTDRIKEE